MTIGLAGPFARPARTVVTLAAILFGGIAVTFGAGLGTSLDRVYNDLSHSRSEPVQVSFPGAPGQGRTREGASGSGPGPACPAWPRRSGPSRPRCAPSRARCTTWPKPTTISTSRACRIACP